MSDKHNDHIAVEYVREVLVDIRRRLKAGADGASVTLDADDCLKILACLAEPAYPNGQPPKDDVRAVYIAIHFHRLMAAGASRKNAIADTAAHFGCSTSTVRDAYKLI